MAPLYQHYNKQKIVIPAGVASTNYTVQQNSGTVNVTQLNTLLRLQATGYGTGYGTNSWARYIPGVSSGSKTITVIFNFNCTNSTNTGIGDNAFGILLSDGGAKCTTMNAWNNIWRSITWNINAPNSAPTSYWGSANYSGSSWLDSSYNFQTSVSYGLRVVDNGTRLTFYRSVDGGSTWVQHTSPTYGDTGLVSSPTQFGFFTMQTGTITGTLFDVTVSSVTIA
jgi:hypothetical protein